MPAPFEELRLRLSRETSLAHIGQLEQRAERSVESAFRKIEEFLKSKKSDGEQPPSPNPGR